MNGLKICFIFLLACPLMMKAQDLTGTWVGHSDNMFVKLVIIHKGDSVAGYTYDKKPGFCQATFTGIYNSKDKELIGSNIELLLNSGDHVLSNYELKYIREFGKEKLHGRSRIKPKDRPSLADHFFATPLYLRKQNNEIDTIPFMLPFINKP